MNAMMTIETMGKPGLALEIPQDQTFDQWVEMGRNLCEGQRVVSWWIGDWWAAGNHRYGERAKAAAEGIFGREFKTLANAASVCRAFETSRRREHLSFAHHAEVASLPPKDADALLDKAEAGLLNRSTIRGAAIIRKTELGLYTPRVDDDPEHTALKAIAAAWNRAPVGARQTFAELVAESDLGVIDP